MGDGMISSIYQFLVVVLIRFSLRGSEKSNGLISFYNMGTSRLVVRFSKCQQTFLLKKLKILDTHITNYLRKTKKLQTQKDVPHAYFTGRGETVVM